MDIDVKTISTSSIFGACVGVATRRLSSDALYGAGLGIAGLQVLSYLGYITIDWAKIERDVTKAVDQDGNGKLDAQDVKHVADKFMKVMKAGIPNAAGFATGFVVGAKYLA